MLGVSLFLSPSTVSALPIPQGEVVEAVPMQAFGMRGGERLSKKYLLAAKKVATLLELDLHIDELKSICDLDDKSVLKLRVAAKLAAQKQATRWANSMNEWDMWTDLGVVEKDEDKEKEVDLDSIDLKKLSPEVLQWFSMDMVGDGQNNGPTTEKVWKKAIESVLSAEQGEKFKAFKSAQQKKFLDANVEYYSQMFGSQLYLTDAKIEKFKKVIRESLKDQPIPPSFEMTYESLVQFGAIKDEAFKDIFDDRQLQRWHILLGPYRDVWAFDAVAEEMEEDNPENDQAESNAEGDGGESDD